jgi:hypothetical protein
MNRVFGKSKPKEPPPSLTDALSSVCKALIKSLTLQGPDFPCFVVQSFFLIYSAG